MKNVKCYKAGYPRPQFVRNSFISLTKEWRFVFDEEKVGDRMGYKDGLPKSTTINVPYSYQTTRSGIDDKRDIELMWYERELDFSGELNSNRAIVNFEGVDYYTKVYVNGSLVCENEGGYHRFSCDVTDFLVLGKGKMVLRVSDDQSARKPRGKQSWTGGEFSCWYYAASGIIKSVWAEIIPNSRIEKVYIRPRFDEKSVELNYSIANFKDDLSIETEISFNGRTIICSRAKQFRDQTCQSFDMQSEAIPFKIEYWTAKNPKLYDVIFRLYDGDKLIDEVGSYFAMRKFATKNDNITVNNTPVFLKMILDQGYIEGGGLTMTEEELQSDVEFMKNIGLNGVRKHQKIEDERFYYFCDVFGLYAFLEMPSMFEFSTDGMRCFTAEYMAVIEQFRNHPCIMAYVPFNESWGVQYVHNGAREMQFTCGIVSLTKALTDGAMVISNDGWEHTTSDILTLHNYAERGEGLLAAYSDIDSAIEDKRVKNPPYKFVYADGYGYNGEPILLSEFGGIAIKTNDGWGYGEQVKGEDEFFDRLNSQLAAIEQMPRISGYCYTQLTDVEQEVNGFMTAARQPKVSVERLKECITKHNN